MTGNHPATPIHYQIGIDVGQYSTGVSAIQTDPTGNPIRTLNLQSYIHDAGVDPTLRKSGGSRKQSSGMARRARRMRRYHERRLKNLDRLLTDNGYPSSTPNGYPDSKSGISAPPPQANTSKTRTRAGRPSASQPATSPATAGGATRSNVSRTSSTPTQARKPTGSFAPTPRP